jgi:hypothetical protein
MSNEEEKRAGEMPTNNDNRLKACFFEVDFY